MATGTALELWRHPVKSMGGERLQHAPLDATGVAGDRAQAVAHVHKGVEKPLTAREAPGLLAWRAGSGPATESHEAGGAANGTATILRSPDGRAYAWEDPDLPAVLAGDLGRPVTLWRDATGALHDLPRSVLVTVEGTRRALEAELEQPLDLRRFRPNLHLDLDAPPWAEHGWQGRRLTFAGGVELELLHPCVRCAIPTRDPDTQAKWPGLLRHLHARHATLFGINARVVRPGRVAGGEAVALHPPA